LARLLGVRNSWSGTCRAVAFKAYGAVPRVVAIIAGPKPSNTTLILALISLIGSPARGSSGWYSVI
jgi:hypothetical protein